MSGLPWASVMYTTLPAFTSPNLPIQSLPILYLADVNAIQCEVPVRFIHLARPVLHIRRCVNKTKIRIVLLRFTKKDACNMKNDVLCMSYWLYLPMWAVDPFWLFQYISHQSVTTTTWVQDAASIDIKVLTYFAKTFTDTDIMYRSGYIWVGTISRGSQSVHQTTAMHYSFSNWVRDHLHTYHVRLTRLCR